MLQHYRHRSLVAVGALGSPHDKVLIIRLHVPKIGLFEAYIGLFRLENSPIASRSFPELIPSTVFYNISPLGSKAQRCLYNRMKDAAPWKEMSLCSHDKENVGVAS